MTHAKTFEALALEYHQTVEGEYGCPGVTCPGVQRLARFTASAAAAGVDRFIAEMETALPEVVLRHAHMAVRREMERAKGRTLRGLSASTEPK